MTIFHIGQRVRVVRASKHPELIGTEVIITAGPTLIRGALKYRTTHNLWGLPHCFEPIIEDDGRKITSWSECLWKPTKELV